MMQQTNSSSLKYIKAKEEDSQEISMTNVIMIKETIRIGIDQIAEIEESNLEVELSTDKIIEVDQDMKKTIEMTIGEESLGDNLRTYQDQNFRRQNNWGGYGGNYRNENCKRGRSKSIERLSSGNINWNDWSSSNSRSRSGSRVSTNRDRIRCYKCREYDHFAKDCLATKEERQTDQIQQMYNLDKKQTSLKMLATGTYDSLSQVGSIEEIRSEHLNI